jgi:hypothetical protein
MNIGSLYAYELKASDIHLADALNTDNHPHRCLYIGSVGVIFRADDIDNPQQWMDIATTLSALSAAADEAWSWAIAEAEKAADVRTANERMAAAEQRRVADFGLTNRQRAMSSAPERDKHTGLSPDSMDSADPYSVTFAFGAGR